MTKAYTTSEKTRTSGTERTGCPLTVRFVTETATVMIFIIIAIMLVIRVVIIIIVIIDLVSTMALIDLMESSTCIRKWLTAMMADTTTIRRD